MVQSHFRRGRSVLGRILVVVGASGVAFSYASHAVAQGEAGAVTPPVVVSRVEAIYPPSALADRRSGDVVLAVTVGADGQVNAVEVLESGGEDMDKASTAAAQHWTFRPAMRGGHAIPARIRVPFHFAPPEAPAALAAPAVQPSAQAAPVVPSPTSAQPATPVQAPSAQAVPTASASTQAPPAPGAPNATPTGAPAAAPSAAESGEKQPAEVEIRGRMVPPSRGASDFNLRIGELSRVPRQNATEMLKLAPGILLTNEGGEGHAEQVFLRGFDAREGQDIEFTVGGVPINESGNLHGNGYADTHFILPELVESLRVIEGPFDPRQGNYAVAGSANYELGLEKRGLTAKYTDRELGNQAPLAAVGTRGRKHAHVCGR